MAYLSLYRKYRPQTFSEILGQEHVSRTLANAIDEDRVAHAYLFTGPRGTGKTSTARILAKALNCANGSTSEPCGKCDSCIAITEGSSLDVFEMDAASHSGVDDTREILAGVALATAGGRKKVYVIDEVHMLTTQSFNALLKTLEEPPDHVVFVLATTEAHRVLPTIVSRTQRFDFRRVPADVTEVHLASVAKQEGIDIESTAVALLARHSEGSLRDALSILDQLSSFDRKVEDADVEALLGKRDEETFIELFEAIAREDVGAIFQAIQTFVAQGADMRQLADDALEHVRSLLLLRTAPDAEGLLDVPVEDRPRLLLQAEQFTTGTLLRTLDLIGQSVIEMRNAPNHRLLLEIALVRAAAPDTDPSATGLLGRIERLERRIGITGAESAAEAHSPGPAGEAASPRAPERLESPAANAASPSVPPSKSNTPSRKRQAPASSTGGAGEASLPASDSKRSGASGDDASTAEPERQVAKAAPSNAGMVGLADYKDAWAATLKEVNRASKRVGAYLFSSRPLRLDDDVLVVATQSDFHARQMKQENNREIFAGALHAALGVRPRVDFVAPDGQVDEPEPTAESDASDLAESQTVAPKSDDPIELVKRGFAAEVVEEKSR
ncbi:MAG TPA: DNA polymerase III subunit gamma/tau [Actinomycetota bacterium]|nr:DNA polymerase III subunit gamma/tau [Actinomycetota bacterium]